MLAGSANAQSSATLPARRGPVEPKARPKANPGAGMKDGLTMKEGRIYLTEMGVSGPITADKKLVNGTLITTTGLVTMPDGTSTQMSEGDMVSLTGRVTSRQSIVEADSLLKIKQFDLKYPGKRKKMEEERLKKEKYKKEREEAKAKAKEKKEKEKSKR
ncbi:DUF6799 domain-containing protein [Hymenobacter saemangeumensis]